MKRPWELSNDFKSVLRLHYLCRVKHYRAPLRCTRYRSRRDLIDALEKAADDHEMEEGESWTKWVQSWFRNTDEINTDNILNDSTILYLFHKYLLGIERQFPHTFDASDAWHACGMMSIFLAFIQSYPNEPKLVIELNKERAKLYIKYFEQFEKNCPSLQKTIMELRHAFDFSSEISVIEYSKTAAKNRLRQIYEFSKSGRRFVAIFNVSTLHEFMVEFSNGYCTLFHSWVSLFSQSWWLEPLETKKSEREKLCINKELMYQQAKLENNELTMCDEGFKKARNIFGRGAMFPCSVLFSALNEMCDVMFDYDESISPKRNSKRMKDIFGACPMSILNFNWGSKKTYLFAKCIMLQKTLGRQSKINEIKTLEKNRKNINAMNVLAKITSSVVE